MDNRKEELEKHFLNIQLTEEAMSTYVVRRTLLQAIKDHLHIFKGEMLDVGCGIMPYRELILENNPAVKKYIGLDLASSSIHNTDIADLHWDAKTIPLEDNSVDSAMATEVLEHSFYPDQTLAEIYRVLKPGGTFYYSVPFLWPLHETPYDAFRYTPFSLKMFLEKAGFTDIDIKSLGGWNTSFAQMTGLWVTQSGLEGRKKRWAMRVARKFIPYLMKHDVKDNRFGEHCMISGLCGTAIKK